MYPNLRSQYNQNHFSNVVRHAEAKNKGDPCAYCAACYHNSIIVRTYLLWAALVPRHLSPWQKLYDKGDYSLFLHITRLIWEAFNTLLNVVIPPGHVICCPGRGRPWSLPPDGMLGLLLCYLGSQMSNKWIRLIFGVTPLPCSRILRIILQITVKWLWCHPLARVKFPNVEKMQLFSDMIRVREPTALFDLWMV